MSRRGNFLFDRILFVLFRIYSSSFLGRHIVDSGVWNVIGLWLLLHLRLFIVFVTTHRGLGLLWVHDRLLISVSVLLVDWHGLVVGLLLLFLNWLANHWLRVVALCDDDGGSFLTLLLISSHGGVGSHSCHSSSTSSCHHGKDATEEQE